MSLKISSLVQNRLEDGKNELGFNVEWNGSSERFVFRWPGEPAPCPGNVALLASLPLAFLLGKDLESPYEVCPKLLCGVEELLKIWVCWQPNYREIQINAPESNGKITTVTEGRERAATLSAGIDSFWMLLSQKPEICVYSVGMDEVPMTESKEREVLAHLRQICDEVGSKLVVIETNAREITQQYGSYALVFGPHLGILGHLLSATSSEFSIASTFSYRYLRPWGSHVTTDPLMTSSDMCIKHFGTHLVRARRLEWLVDHPLAMKHLRVCPKNVEGAYNCGKCTKCRHAGMTLAILGKSHLCSAIPDIEDKPELWTAENPYEARLVEENLELARSVNAPEHLIQRLLKAKERHTIRHWFNRVMKFIKQKTVERVTGLIRSSFLGSVFQKP